MTHDDPGLMASLKQLIKAFRFVPSGSGTSTPTTHPDEKFDDPGPLMSGQLSTLKTSLRVQTSILGTIKSAVGKAKKSGVSGAAGAAAGAAGKIPALAKLTSVIGPLLGALGLFAASLGVLAAGAISAGLFIKGFADRALQAGEELKQFSPAIARIYKDIEVNQVLQGMWRGKKIEGEQGGMVEASIKLSNTMAGLGIVVDKVNAIVGEWGANLLNDIIVSIAVALELIISLLRSWIPFMSDEKIDTVINILHDIHTADKQIQNMQGDMARGLNAIISGDWNAAQTAMSEVGFGAKVGLP